MPNPLRPLGNLAGAAVLTTGLLRSWLTTDNARERARLQKAVHPHLQTTLINYPVETSSPAVLRAAGRIARLVPLRGHRRDGVATTVENHGGLKMRIHRPVSGARADAALLWLHCGAPALDDRLLTFIAAELGVTVVAPHYSQAPFPAGLDDAWTALTWLRGRGHSRIAVGGASAGGGLAAGLVQRAVDEDVPVDYQLLVYPRLDDRTAVRVTEPAGAVGRYVLTPGLNAAAWRLHLADVGGPGVETLPDYAAPARRTDLAGTPPTFIGVGSLDLLFAENRDYARALIDAGVHVDWFQPTGAYHGFDHIVGPQMNLFHRAVVEKLGAGLGLTSIG